ncbi:MAG: XdhC family protein [Pseudomonadales bacterium]|jgi:xanthine dehydrogenase accessory factor|nr:XdhC family protein [Pseudomonadales bacterium]
MQAVDKEVLTQLLKWLGDQQKCWLATVIQTWGSSPRPVGSLFACNEGGQMVGSLSGGCVEDDLLAKLANSELAAEGPQFFEYGVSTEEAEQFGLPCGGTLHIVVEPQHLNPDAQANLTTLTEELDARRCVARQVDLKSGRSTVRCVTKHSPLVFDAETQVLTHTYGPRLQLFIIGAGMVSQYLAEMALMLNYEVTVCDPRQAMVDDFSVAGVRTIVDMPDDAIRACANDELTAIVALTHDPRIDDMGLMEALTTQAFYIGAMGSTRTSASRRERLLALDVSAENIDKLHAPIGLPIGSKTPPEIAIAILAEISAIRSQRLPEVIQQLNSASAG